jgi:hypothetical protein
VRDLGDIQAFDRPQADHFFVARMKSNDGILKTNRLSARKLSCHSSVNIWSFNMPAPVSGALDLRNQNRYGIDRSLAIEGPRSIPTGRSDKPFAGCQLNPVGHAHSRERSLMKTLSQRGRLSQITHGCVRVISARPLITKRKRVEGILACSGYKEGEHAHARKCTFASR